MVDRGDGTFACDLNGATLPEFSECDVAVFSGVLEYVNDAPRLIGHLEKTFSNVIASYSILETNGGNRRKHAGSMITRLKNLLPSLQVSGLRWCTGRTGRCSASSSSRRVKPGVCFDVGS